MKSFYITLIDDDLKKFNVYGPKTDDTDISNKTAELQRQNRNVRCITDDALNNTEQALIQSYARQLGYSLDKNLNW